MSLKELNKELQKYDKGTLIKHILELYKKYNSVKEYFDFYMNPDEDELLKKYKEKVREGFFPKRGNRLRLSSARKAIKEFKKLEVSKRSIGDLSLYYIECGVEFISTYEDISESFYKSANNILENALKIFQKENILMEYKERLGKLIEESKYSGYGFGEDIESIIDDYND